MADEVFVEGGSFRVDRERALEKLKRFQVRGPAGVLLWLRCAVASGATRFELTSNLTSFTIRFDGKALSKAELRDPYGVLFEGGDRRRRHLAYGLLWALGLSPRQVSLKSGPLSITAKDPSSETLTTDAEPESDIVLQVEGLWRHALMRPWAVSKKTLLERCAAAPCRISVNGNLIEFPPPGGIAFELPGGPDSSQARVVMRPSPHERPARSTALVHLDGVLAGRFEYPRRFLPAESLVDASELALDASQASAVRDGRLDALLEAVAARERELLSKLLSYRPAPSQPRGTQDLRYDGDGYVHVVAAEPSGEGVEAVRQAGYALLNDPVEDLKDPLLARLWSAPLFRKGRSFADVVSSFQPEDGESIPDNNDLAAFLKRLKR